MDGSKLRSRKWWSHLLTEAMIIFLPLFGLDLTTAQIQGLVAVALGYLISQGWVDGKREQNGHGPAIADDSDADG